VEYLENRMRETSNAAAERNWQDRNMSEAAKAEAKQAVQELTSTSGRSREAAGAARASSEVCSVGCHGLGTRPRHRCPARDRSRGGRGDAPSSDGAKALSALNRMINAWKASVCSSIN